MCRWDGCVPGTTSHSRLEQTRTRGPQPQHCAFATCHGLINLKSTWIKEEEWEFFSPACWAALGNGVGGVGWLEASNFKKTCWREPERRKGERNHCWGSRRSTKIQAVVDSSPHSTVVWLGNLGQVPEMPRPLAPSGQIKQWKHV